MSKSTQLGHTPRARGFTLVEVMVALAVLTIGLLGIAKMQALALSSTTIANARSLAALEASSLAASMHADRAYWAAGGLVPAGLTVTGTAISDPTLAAEPLCTSASGVAAPPYCDPVQMAGYELQQWAASLNALLPNDQASITCTNTVGLPVTCTIQITWSENSVSINATQTAAAAANAAAGQTAQYQLPTYTLVIEP